MTLSVGGHGEATLYSSVSVSSSGSANNKKIRLCGERQHFFGVTACLYMYLTHGDVH